MATVFPLTEAVKPKPDPMIVAVPWAVNVVPDRLYFLNLVPSAKYAVLTDPLFPTSTKTNPSALEGAVPEKVKTVGAADDVGRPENTAQVVAVS